MIRREAYAARTPPRKSPPRGGTILPCDVVLYYEKESAVNTLKLIGLIVALMLSAALACSAAMLASSLLTGTMAPSPSEVLTVAAETGVLLGLLVWLRATLRSAYARSR